MGYCLLCAINSFQIHAGCSLVILFENALCMSELSMVREKVTKKFSYSHRDREHIYA